MRIEAAVPYPAPKASARKTPISISRWINERYPPLQELLSAHDVARLTRRPRWVLAGLCLLGRFPTKLKFRGRAIGWRRSEILDWMARDLSITDNNAAPVRSCPRRNPLQKRLPLKCTTSPSRARGGLAPRAKPLRPTATSGK